MINRRNAGNIELPATGADQHASAASLRHDLDVGMNAFLERYKKMSKPFLHKLKPKLGRGYPILSKTNLRHFLNVAFWPMGSYACVVPTAPMRNWWPFPASGVDSVLRVVDGVWRRRLLTWLITLFPGCRCCPGCSHCRSRCATC